LRIRGRIERQLHKDGVRFAGVDEVGRGCLAGPVVAACVVLDFPRLLKLDREARWLIRDSKQLSAEQRARIAPKILEVAASHRVETADVATIERLGIAGATYLAMRRALAACADYDLVLVDGKAKIAGYDGEQRAVVKGDALCFSIAAASILAKEARDGYMRGIATDYPAWGFDSHVGYGTKQHLHAIEQHGLTPLHRRNFEPVRQVAARQAPERTLFD
jgi:ribonuclease HII